MVADAELKLTEERLARASVLQELTVAALDLFDPRRSMDDFLDRLAVRLGCVAALCVGEAEPSGAARLFGAAGLSRASRRMPLGPLDPADSFPSELPYPELAREGLVRWSFRITAPDAGQAASGLVLFFEGGPRLPVQFHGVVERLVEIVRTALLHRQLYARTLESERRLYEQKTLLESQREAAFDGILFVAVDASVSCNRRFRELFHLPDGPLPPPERLLSSMTEHAQEPAEVRARLERYAASGEAANVGEIRLHDGHILDVTCTPVRSGEGVYFGRSWGFRDATERRRAEWERLRLLEKEQAAREAAEDAQRRAAFLAEASRLLAASLDWAATLERVAHLALPGFADWCVVDVVEEDRSLHRVAVAHVDPARAEAAHQLRIRFPPNLSWPAGVPKVLRTGQSELIAEVTPEHLQAIARDEGHRALLEELGAHSLLIVPLTARGKQLGAITLAYGPSGRHYGDKDLALAEDLAIRAALAVDNARLYLRTQEAVRARDEFLSIASHELRTPITSLQLAAQGLLRLTKAGSLAKVPPEFLASSLETATRQSGRMAQLIDRLLDVSRIQAGRLDLQLEQVDLTTVAREILAQTAAEAARSGCAVTLKAEVPVVGRWDRARLEQVVANLLSNALKYGAGKPVEIEVTAEADLARLVVRDQGIGIPPERVGRIFERFERAVSARHYSGLGLGLYIVRRVLDALGGSIQVQSQPGSGSTFLVELPCNGPHAKADSERGVA
ncbi:MAG: GAF domain-containing protein [Deltaproteobacteria bacterium]|nr:GAF domain-containing protein [Deltaproteobacteria bacterium]